ncbi:MAG: type II/IV secretion system protein [Parcubacteria group bacterium]|nr:type II/IV secretion system protein [Parcubacteria group bacterium]
MIKSTDRKSEIEKALASPPDKISIISLVDDIITYAYGMRSSDIHFDPAEDKINVRFRIDGVLRKIFSIPKELQSEIISRIKVVAGLRTDEHNAAQDGRFRSAMKEARFDIRVSVVPTYYGENAILRLLSEQGQEFNLKGIGFSDRDLGIVQRAIQKPYGMILATGPTGSGKTTTLYTILKILNTEGVSIITIEDPIEYSLEGINQIQVNSQTALTFANGLRAILRQDPNIIMVGEIRDQETANIAVNAALTGHLLLSTLHTNDAATTLPRLIDMKVEPFLIASTVNIAIAQRLVRKICPDCKTKRQPSAAELQTLAAAVPQEMVTELRKGGIYSGAGCAQCVGSGYLGRIGIHEVMEVTDAVRDAIVKRFSSSQIKEIAVREGMTTMLEDGLRKVLAAITTIEEVLRVMHE